MLRPPAVHDAIHRALLSATLWRLLPTPATLYLNRACLREPEQVPDLPRAAWSQRERRALLVGSEERLRNIEAKGPGLATVSAVIVAAVLLAFDGGWNDSGVCARVILVLAAVYTVLSLFMPLYLVGPLPRDTIHLDQLVEAVPASDPDEALAARAAEAAMRNNLRNLRLTNMLAAARRELSYAFALLLLWLALVRATGLL